MANPRDRILLVESDPAISDLIARQALQSAGFQVFVAREAAAAISKALQWSPDLIIADLNLPGLSGKDLLVALSSQGVQVPVIILAQRGLEADIIQTFRLGAADYLLLPAREAEVISAVERVLRQGQDRRERERLSKQLEQANQELQARVRELTTIFAVGKAVTSVTDPGKLLENVLEAALRVTRADLGWFLVRDSVERPFVVAAERGLPPALGARLGQPWDDGVSSLVAMSGEILSIHGDPIKRFKIAALGQSALIVPVRVQQKNVVGLLAMMRRAAAPFGASEQHLLGALADFASISMMNARLMRTLEERARAQQQAAETALRGGKVNFDLLEAARAELGPALAAAFEAVETLGKDPTARWRADQRQLLYSIHDQLLAMSQGIASVSPYRGANSSPGKPRAALTELARSALQKLQTVARLGGVSMASELPAEPVEVPIEGGMVAQMLEGLFSAVIRSSSPGAMTRFSIEKVGGEARVSARTSGLKVDPKALDAVLQAADNPRKWAPGAAARLGLVQELAAAQGGKTWLACETGGDTVFYLSLPLLT